MAKRAQNLVENDKIVAQTLGRRLYLLRHNRGLSLDEVGNNVCVSHQVMSAYERGIRKPSLSILIGLSTYFGTSVDYLLGLEPLETAIGTDDPRNKMIDFVKTQ